VKNKVIYIIGSGRSGTTLLDILLGNADDIFSAGELNRYTERNGVPTDVNCKEAGIFWNEILNGLSKENLLSPINYSLLSRKFEHHFALFRSIVNDKKSWNDYSIYQQKFFNILFQKVNSEFNKNIIIDSSKYPLRGYYLSKILGNSISYIYIKRNPLAVVESFGKKDVEQAPKNRLMANLYLLGSNGIATSVIKKIYKTNAVSTVFYEDLLNDPISVLSEIETGLNISLENSKKLIMQEQPLKVGYLFDGNRLRLEKEIKLKKANHSYKPKSITDKFFYTFHKKVWYK
jgi:hypothetical protein